MAELPIESPSKYGKDVYDDIDEFADMLGGTGGNRRPRANGVDVGSRNEEMDVDVLREAINNPRKYGG